MSPRKSLPSGIRHAPPLHDDADHRPLIGTAIHAEPGHAQSVEFITATKGQRQVQADAAGTISTEDWCAEFAVQGVDLETLSPEPRIEGPIGVGEPGFNGGFLGWNPDLQMWNFGWPDFNGWGVATKPELDALFGDGADTFSQDGTPFVTVTLAGDAYPAEAPLLTLEGGRWLAGRYLVDPREETFRATTDTWTEFGTGPLDVISLEILDSEHRVESWSTQGGAASVTLEVPNAAFIPGTRPDLRGLHTNAIELVSIPDLGDALGGVTYESQVDVELVVGKLEDFDLDGMVGASDLGAILVQWGPCKRGCDADLDGDGMVGASDIGMLLVAWGSYL